MKVKEVRLIPRPQSVEMLKGQFVFGSDIKFSGKANEYRKFLIMPFSKKGSGEIVFLDKDMYEGEYFLEIKEDKISIEAGTNDGFFWGVMTLKQLLIDHFEDGLSYLPCMRIEDYPRFSYRGFMFDSVRHFFSIDMLQKIVDTLAVFKFNYLHLHLSDDQGFRIESKKFPNLNTVGSVRKGTKNDNIEVSGYYTQKELKDLVLYAKERSITIIPEIDLPAHTGAIIASYNNLSCKGDKREVPTYFGVMNNVLCAGKSEVYDFVYSLLDEVMDIFPSEYIHIGGDEALKEDWKKCPHCQKMIEDNNLSGVEELQGLFTNFVCDYIKRRGRKVIVWNEGLNSGRLYKDTICQYWQEFGKPKKVLNFLNGGGKVIVSQCNPYYLDYPYGMHSLKDGYTFDPILKGLTDDGEKNILGIEAPLWTEYVVSENEVWKQMFPRLLAVSERGWSKVVDYQKFYDNIDMAEKLLDILKAEYTLKKDANVKGVKALGQTIKFWSHIVDRTSFRSLKNIMKINSCKK